MSATDFKHVKVVQRAVDLGGRVPPHNDEAEAAVLSAALCSRAALDEALGVLPDPELFYSDANRRLWQATLALREAGTPVDVQTIAAWLRDRDRLQAIGGISYLATIVDATPSVLNVGAHATIVKDKARIRALAERCQLIAAQCYGDYGETQEFLDEAEQSIYEVARTEDPGSAVQAFDLAQDAYARITAIWDGARLEGGLRSGYDAVDAITNGMRPGALTIIGARPAVGKTAMGLDIALNIASVMHDDELVGGEFFSMEMPKDELAHRMLAGRGELDLSRLTRIASDDPRRARLLSAATQVGGLPLWIDDRPRRGLMHIRAALRRRKAMFDKQKGPSGYKQRIGFIVVDYLQIMRCDAKLFSREQEVGHNAQGLKEIAKEFGIHVIALAQLNRELDKRTDMRPRLSDLRESGGIEAAADVIQLLHRPAAHMTAGIEGAIAKYTEVLMPKVRGLQPGRALLAYDGEYTRFRDPQPGEFDALLDSMKGSPAKPRSARSRWPNGPADRPGISRITPTANA